MPNTEELIKIESKIDSLSIEIKNKLEIDLKEIRMCIEAMDDRLDTHSDTLRSLLQWRDANGSPGAEDRLRAAEQSIIAYEKENIPPRMNQVEANIITLQRIADHAIMEGVQGAVTDMLDKRSRTAIEKLKAWGPIVAAGLAALAVVLSAVL